MTKKTYFNWILFGLPLATLVTTSAYITLTLHQQELTLQQLALAADQLNPVVSSRAELATEFDRYIHAAGLKIGKLSSSLPSAGYSTGAKSSKSYVPSTDSERVYGNPDAQFYVIEYSDFECAYCKEHFPQMLDLVDSSSGNIAMVFKHVPVHGQASRTESLASECAAEQGGNPAFYKMARSIFRYTQSDGRGLSVPIDKLADENGVDGKRLIECINSERPSAKIAEDVREASRLNIQQTPTNIVVYGDKSAMVQGSVNGTGLMQMMAQLAGAEGS